MMIRSRKFERRFAFAVVASVVALLSFASAAQANGVERISVLNGFGGSVNAISEPDSNGTRYLGGSFTSFRPWDTGGGALVGASSGDVIPTFPKVNGNIEATAADGSGGFYIGGAFSCIGPNTSGSCNGVDDVPRNSAAHINADGSVDPDWNPNLNDWVNAIEVLGSTVYLGGWFTTVGGTTRNYAAAVTTDGAGTLTSWNPDLNDGVLAIEVLGSTVYLGGEFNTVGGTERNGAAAVDTDGTLTGWDPNLSYDSERPSSVHAIGALGSTVYLGGEFNTVGGTERNGAAAVNNTDGTLTSWNLDLNDGVLAIEVLGSTVYLGGWFTTVGGTTRNYAAAVDATTGIATDWNPDLNGRVYAIGVLGSTVYLGGAFTTAGGIARNRAAAVSTGGILDPDWNPNLNGGVRAIGVLGSTVYLGGEFYAAGGISRNYAAALGTDGTLTSWNPDLNGPVRAIEVLGSTVYLGGAFTTAGGGTTRNRAAAVSTGGTLDPDWNPNLNGPVNAIGAFGSTVYLGGEFTTAGGILRSRVTEEFAVVPPPVLFDLTVSKSGLGGGTVASSPAGIDCGATCSTTFASGTSVTLTATPAAGSSFTGWSGSECSGTSTCTVVMSEARAVTAEFAVVPPGQFDLMVSKSGTGAGTVTSSPAGINCGSDCSETLADGSSVTLTATPAAGSSFTGWNGSGCSGTLTCTVTISAARAVDAKFMPSNRFTMRSIKAGRKAVISVFALPGRGELTQIITRKRSSRSSARLTVCKTSRKATQAGRVKLTCKLNSATRKALRKRSLRVSMKTTFKPTGGLTASKTQAVTLKRKR